MENDPKGIFPSCSTYYNGSLYVGVSNGMAKYKEKWEYINLGATPYHFQVFNGKLYILTDNGSILIYDGKNISQNILPGYEIIAFDIDVTNGNLYWSDWFEIYYKDSNNNVHSLNYPGSGIAFLGLAVHNGSVVALDYYDGVAYYYSNKWMEIPNLSEEEIYNALFFQIYFGPKGLILPIYDKQMPIDPKTGHNTNNPSPYPVYGEIQSSENKREVYCGSYYGWQPMMKMDYNNQWHFINDMIYDNRYSFVSSDGTNDYVVATDLIYKVTPNNNIIEFGSNAEFFELYRYGTSGNNSLVSSSHNLWIYNGNIWKKIFDNVYVFKIEGTGEGDFWVGIWEPYKYNSYWINIKEDGSYTLEDCIKCSSEGSPIYYNGNLYVISSRGFYKRKSAGNWEHLIDWESKDIYVYGCDWCKTKINSYFYSIIRDYNSDDYGIIEVDSIKLNYRILKLEGMRPLDIISFNSFLYVNFYDSNGISHLVKWNGFNWEFVSNLGLPSYNEEFYIWIL